MSYRSVNPNTPKRKRYLAICSTVLCFCKLCSAGEIPVKNTFSTRNQALFSIVGYIFGRTLKKEGLPHPLHRPCEKSWKDVTYILSAFSDKFKAKTTATQESFRRGKRCIEVWSFVLAHGHLTLEWLPCKKTSRKIMVFLITEKPGAVALIGGKDLFLFQLAWTYCFLGKYLCHEN